MFPLEFPLLCSHLTALLTQFPDAAVLAVSLSSKVFFPDSLQVYGFCEDVIGALRIYLSAHIY